MMLYTVKPTGTVCERWEYESEHVGGIVRGLFSKPCYNSYQNILWQESK